jgi:hypothetical protein
MNFFNEKPLIIKINTNLSMKNPNEKEDTFLTFTSSMIKMADSSIQTLLSLEEYPYFTSEVKYPWEYLQSLPYQRKLEFFY